MRRWSATLRACAATALLGVAAVAWSQPAAAEDDAIAGLQGAYAAAVPAGEQADFYRDLIPAVIARVRRSYAKEVDLAAFVASARKALAAQAGANTPPAGVFTRAINAALGELDPYSRYIDPRRQASERDLPGGGFVGVGLQVEPGEGGLRVTAPMPGTPAARAGLQAGDLILQVDDQPLRDTPVSDAVAMIRGQPGTTVTLTVRRGGSPDAFSVALTREAIRRQAALWRMEGKVLVLRLNGFGSGVSETVHQAIAEASAAAAPEGVVLDLRGNPGGLLHEGIRIADTFLNQGAIVSVQGRTPANHRTWHADADELLPGVPMVVLVDRGSASASELVAAALQDNRRAIVMGQRSFGKGSVQNTFSLGEEIKGTLKLTSAYFQRPSTAAVHRAGVAPDIELVVDGRSGGAPRPGEWPAPAPQARIDAAQCAPAGTANDPAVACALGYLRAGSVERFVGGFAAAPP